MFPSPLTMIADSKPAMWIRDLTQNDLAACLVVDFKTDPGEYLNSRSPRNNWHSAHGLISTVPSQIGGGIGSLCLRRLSR